MDIDYSIVTLEESNLDRIKSLWECQMEYHIGISINFVKERQSTQFEDRREEILKGCDQIKIDYVIRDKSNEEIGYCLSTINHYGKGELDSLYIKEKYRNLGIGKILVQKSLKWMGEAGAKQISLYVIPENEGAISFYEALGFKQRSIHLMK